MRRSMLVTRLPNRSTQEHDARSARDSLTSGCGNVDLLIVVHGPSERGKLDALGQPGGGRREPIAPFERAADRRPGVAALGELHDLLRRASRATPPSARRCRAPRTGSRPLSAAMPRRAEPTPGSTTAKKDGARRENTGRTRRAASAPSTHVVRRDVVRDVDERDVGADPDHHALHRPGVVIARAEVAQERDDGTHVTPSSCA